MEKRKTWLLDALVKLGVAQCDSESPCAEDITQTHRQIAMLVDLADNKVSDLYFNPSMNTYVINLHLNV